MNQEPSAHTRTLRQLELPARLCDTGASALRRALYVDCETTGLSVEHDEVTGACHRGDDRSPRIHGAR